jgi:hypothetical protein
MSKSILSALSVLVVLLVVFLLLKKSPYTDTQKGPLSEGFQKFKELDPSDVTRVVLEKGKGKVELEKRDGQWVVASSFGYPADPEQLGKLLTGLGSIAGGTEVGTSSASFADFEVDKENGGYLSLYGKGSGGQNDQLLASLVIGKYATGHGIGSSHVFLRFGDEASTYDVESDLRSEARLYSKDAEGKSYLLTEIFKVPEKPEDGGPMEIEMVRLVRPDKADLIVERRTKEVPVEDTASATPDEPTQEGAEAKEGEEKKEEKKPETKKETYYVATCGSEVHEVGKDEEWTARGLLDRGKSIRIEDVVEPKPLSEYGLENPQLKAVIAYRKKDDPNAELKRETFLFGNAKKDEEGKTRSYYFTIEGEKFKDRVYLLQDYTFDGWNKELKDFLPKPKAEEKPAEEKKAEEEPAVESTGAASPAESAPPAEATPPAEGTPPAGGTAPAEASPPVEEPKADAPPAPAPEPPAPEPPAVPEPAPAPSPEPAPKTP